MTNRDGSVPPAAPGRSEQRPRSSTPPGLRSHCREQYDEPPNGGHHGKGPEEAEETAERRGRRPTAEDRPAEAAPEGQTAVAPDHPPDGGPGRGARPGDDRRADGARRRPGPHRPLHDPRRTGAHRLAGRTDGGACPRLGALARRPAGRPAPRRPHGHHPGGGPRPPRERTEAVITWAHGSKDKGGRTHWTCGIRRTDGKPLPHAEYQGSGCYGSSDIGTTTTVLVDPEGWAPPASGDLDFAFLSGGVYAVAGLSLLWALLAAAAARRTLRESPAASRA